MRVRFPKLMLLAATLLTAPQAMGQNVFLVQLGSYKTEAEADSYWQKVKGEHKEILGSLFHQNSAITIPPSNSQVYRLQGGPFPSREDAASACNAVAQEGVNCFVVESAAFLPKEPPVATAKAEPQEPQEKPAAKAEPKATEAPALEAAQAALAPAKEDIAELPATIPDSESGEISLPSVEPAPTASSLAEEFKAAMAAPAPEMPSTKAVEKPVRIERPVKAPQAEPVKAETANAPVLPNIIEDKQPEAVAEPVIQPATPSLPPAKEVAVNTPVPPKPAISEPNVPATLPSEKTTETVLPWQNKSPAEKLSKVVNIKPTEAQPVSAAPVVPSPVKEVAHNAEEIKTVVAEPAKPAAPAITAGQPMPAPVPQAMAAAPAVPMQIAAPSSRRMELLPPPGTSLSNETRVMSSQQGTEPAVQAQAQPQNMQPMTAAATNRMRHGPRKLGQVDMLSPTDGRVEVGEAIPVPLSEIPTPAKTETAPAQETTKAEPFAAPEIPLSGKRAQGWKASPSTNLSQHSYWVQLSYFASDQAALNHWQILRKKLPNLTREMRVRVTKPFMRIGSTPRVSLQIGPFLTTSDVSQLCNVATADELTCRPTSDMGTGTVANLPRTREVGSGFLTRRTVANYQGVSNHPQYWVQLGSYHSRGDASMLWDELKSQHMELQPYLPYITQPTLSSSPEPIFRLRTGPFQLRYSAQELCDQLRTKAVSCLVVSG